MNNGSVDVLWWRLVGHKHFVADLLYEGPSEARAFVLSEELRSSCCRGDCKLKQLLLSV
jgi:hypothetical protein